MRRLMYCGDIFQTPLSAQVTIQDVDHIAEAQELRGRAHGREGGELHNVKIKTGIIEVTTCTLFY